LEKCPYQYQAVTNKNSWRKQIRSEATEFYNKPKELRLRDNAFTYQKQRARGELLPTVFFEAQALH